MNRKLKNAQLILVAFTYLLCLPPLILAQKASTSSGAAASPAVREVSRSGKTTPKPVQKALGIPEKAEPGKLISAEAKAPEQHLEKKKGVTKKSALQAGMEKTEEQSESKLPPQFDETYFKKTPQLKLPSLEIFGHRFFSDTAGFTPIKSVSTPKDYIIGPDDELLVTTWGRMDSSDILKVNDSGIIILPKVGQVTVGKLTFGEVEDLIKSRLGAISGVKAGVTLGELKAIQVFVLGEVKNPGVYTVDAQGTIVNVLHASGGPTALGSLRKVVLRRDGKVLTHMDFYDLLLKGEKSGDRTVTTGDIIFVPQTGPMVSVSGNVRRPAIYELNEKRTLETALNLAGGLKPTAYAHRIQISRALENKVQVVLNVSVVDLEKKKETLLQDGDLVTVSGILPFPINGVYLYGNVLRPGEYAYKPGFRVLDILPGLKSLKTDAYLDYAVIKRYRLKDMESELIPFDLRRLFLFKDAAQNIPLTPMDEIFVFSKEMFEDKEYATVKGQVRKPGRYPIVEMKLKDLILKAGDLKDDAYLPKAELIRTEKDRMKRTIYFDVARIMADDPEQNILVQDEDQIIIHSIWEERPKEFVTIKGEINKPGEYALTKGMALRDLIFKAESLTRSAYMKMAELVRYDIVNREKVKTSVFDFNVRLALQDDPAHNKKLRPLDEVYIKEIPGWGSRKKTITLFGEIRFPGPYQILKNEKLHDVIQRAGGITPEAYLHGAVFTRASVRIQQQRQLNDLIKTLEIEIASLTPLEEQAFLTEKGIANHAYFISAQKTLLAKLREKKPTGRMVISLLPAGKATVNSSNPVLEHRDSLYIPKNPGAIIVLGAVYNPMAFGYEAKHPDVAYYLAKSGGPTLNAQKNHIYVVRADGTAVSRTGETGSFEKTTLFPGDTIIVPHKGVRPAYITALAIGETDAVSKK